MRNRAGKRYYTIYEPDVKETGNTDQLIEGYLDEHGPSTFGAIWHHVNEILPDRYSYSRKGFALHLDGLISKRKIARRAYKQGHYLYYLTKKGQEDISLKARKLGEISLGLLRVNFPEKKFADNEKYFLKRISQRIGFFMLFSCIQGLKHTSLNRTKENVSLLQEWMRESNPSWYLFTYFSGVLSSFLKYRSEEEALTPIFQSKDKMRKLLELEQKLKELFPQEYDLCTHRIGELPKKIKDDLEYEGFLKKYKDWIKRLDRQMKNAKKRKLKPNECPRCHHDGKGLVKSGPYKDYNFFLGYRIHGPDNAKWCDLCSFEISNPLIKS